jgi:serine/threonine protein kinase
MSDYSSSLTVGRLLSSGGFGDVHEGVHQLHGKVAVKVLRRNDLESQEDWVARSGSLLSEAKNMKEAKHPNVVPVLDVLISSHDGSLAMVSELCESGSLEERYRNGPIGISEMRQILTGVCRGLDVIHARQLIHRDIKPGNVLCSKSGWKIADFGLVTDDLVEGYGSSRGYTSHLAPEVFRDHITSARTDVYAVGMTAYRLLHGQAFCDQIFERKFFCDAEFDPQFVRDVILNGDLASRLPWLPHIPHEWRRVLRKALHSDSTQRFQSSMQFINRIGQLPIEPDWHCDYAITHASWRLHKNGRDILANLREHSPRKHTWTGISIGGRRTRKMGGSDLPGPRRQILPELENFLLSR